MMNASDFRRFKDTNVSVLPVAPQDDVVDPREPRLTQPQADVPPAAPRVEKPEADGIARHAPAMARLILMQGRLRDATELKALCFTLVNETHQVAPYFQSILWRPGNRKRARIEAISGISEVNHQAPSVLWLRKAIAAFAKTEAASSTGLVKPEDLPAKLAKDWDDWLPEHVVWMPMRRPNGSELGGILFTRQEPFTNAEMTLLEPAVHTACHAWSALDRGRDSRGKRVRSFLSRTVVKLAVLGALVAAGFIPVHESALAPATVVASNPLVVTAPLRGVVRDFHVKPNQEVAKGDLLITLDRTELESQVAVSRQGLAVATADLRRAVQKSFNDLESKTQLEVLKARAKEKQLEVQRAEAMLAWTEIRAAGSGIAVFADASSWIGRPVAIGEKILEIARPEDAELEVWLAVADAISLEQGSDVQMFLNTDPSAPLSAILTQTSFESEARADQAAAFRLKASFSDDVKPRIGLSGTAKVYGDEVRLYEYLFRRPLSILRQRTGL